MTENTKTESIADLEERMKEGRQLISKLLGVREEIARTFGTGDALYKLIKRAAEGADIRELRMAMAAYEIQLPELSERTPSPWGKGPPITEEKAEEAARIGKPLRLVLQFDAFDPEEVYSGQTWEPKKCGIPVRVHILAGTSNRESLLSLEKIKECLARDWDYLTKGEDTLSNKGNTQDDLTKPKEGEAAPF